MIRTPLQIQVSPYEYAFQNQVDSCLYACDVAIILLGCAYTLFRNSGVSLSAQRAIENVLVVLLICSIALTGIFLAWGYRFGVLRQTQKEFDALQSEWAATDAPRLTRLRGLTMGIKPDGEPVSSKARDDAGDRTCNGAARWRHLSKWSQRIVESSKEPDQASKGLVGSSTPDNASSKARVRWQLAAGAWGRAAAPSGRRVADGGANCESDKIDCISSCGTSVTSPNDVELNPHEVNATAAVVNSSASSPMSLAVGAPASLLSEPHGLGCAAHHVPTTACI